VRAGDKLRIRISFEFGRWIVDLWKISIEWFYASEQGEQILRPNKFDQETITITMTSSPGSSNSAGMRII